MQTVNVPAVERLSDWAFLSIREQKLSDELRIPTNSNADKH